MQPFSSREHVKDPVYYVEGGVSGNYYMKLPRARWHPDNTDATKPEHLIIPENLESQNNTYC